MANVNVYIPWKKVLCQQFDWVLLKLLFVLKYRIWKIPQKLWNNHTIIYGFKTAECYRYGSTWRNWINLVSYECWAAMSNMRLFSHVQSSGASTDRKLQTEWFNNICGECAAFQPLLVGVWFHPGTSTASCYSSAAFYSNPTLGLWCHVCF